MFGKQAFVCLIVGIFLLGSGWIGSTAGEEKKAEAKTGSVVGVVAAKGDNWIEVKADGEEKARRYTPNWVGGAPAQGGGLDKNMLKTIKDAPVGARVKLDWKFDERARVVKLEILKKDGDKKDSDKK